MMFVLLITILQTTATVPFANTVAEQKDEIRVQMKALNDVVRQHIPPAKLPRRMSNDESPMDADSRKTGEMDEPFLVKNQRTDPNADLLYQGDIILAPNEIKSRVDNLKAAKRLKRQAARNETYPYNLWKNNTVHYWFWDIFNATERQIIRAQMDRWEAVTCIRFIEDPAKTTTDRLEIWALPQGGACASSVGRQGGEQGMQLGPGCPMDPGTVLHELAHVLGFWHTATRWDRDDYLTVHYENLQANSDLSAFVKESKEINYNYDLPYDFGSVVHYGSKNWIEVAKAGENNVLQAFDADYNFTMGTKNISFIDIVMMNKHYKCDEKCANSQTKCEQQGTPNPNDCSKCICPSGFGGDFCERRADGCGETLIATKEEQDFEFDIGEIEAPEIAKYCTHLITAPPGTKVELKFKSLHSGACGDGCHYGGIEVKVRDMRLTGYRYCCHASPVGRVLTSDTNNAIITTNRVRKFIDYELPTQPQLAYSVTYRYVGTPNGNDADTSVPSNNTEVLPTTTVQPITTPSESTTTTQQPTTKSSDSSSIITTTVNTPQSTISTSDPNIPTDGQCGNYYTDIVCDFYKSHGFCDSISELGSMYNQERKKLYCGKTCGLC